MNAALIPLVTGTEVTFWIVGPLAVLGAIGLVTFRKAVYAALSMAVAMLSLAALYASLNAPFLAMVQIIVYTGAVLMMFLFVLMMVGVDKPDSAIETIKGQRVTALLFAVVLLGLLIFALSSSFHGVSAGDLTQANAANGGNVQSVAVLVFGRYVFVFELLSAVLITAAIGAMVLAHHHRVQPRKGQRAQAADRMKAYAETGEHPGTLPNSGVFARNNAIGAAALLPDGSIAEKSVSQTLVRRGATVDTTEMVALAKQNFAAIEASARDEEEDE